MIELLRMARSRRSVLGASVAGASLPATRRARAAPAGNNAPPDVAIYCDPTLAAAIRRAGELFQARTKAPVAVFSAPPPLMLAQLEHGAHGDILLTATDAVDDALRRGLVRPAGRYGRWSNRLVLAARAGNVGPSTVLGPESFARALGDGPIALADPTAAATMDGRKVLDRYGLAAAAAGKIIGAANTGDVGFLVSTGVARLGLLYLTDVRADPALEVVATLDAAAWPILYAPAVNAKAQSPNADALVDFLAASEARHALAMLGLETLA